MINYINKFLNKLYTKELQEKIDFIDNVLKENPELDPESKKFDKKKFMKWQILLMMR